MSMQRMFAAVFAALAFTSLAFADGLKSGPQEGARLPGAFHPLNVNGENAGEKHCLYCANGDRPVAMIFAREVTPALTKLIKEVDAANVKNGEKMGSFVVFLGDTDSLKKKLTSVAEDSKLKRTILSIDSPAGPEKYKVAREADVTVVLYTDFTVKANWAFKKGELKEKDIPTIVGGLKKILD
jgi:hypothetical protein